MKSAPLKRGDHLSPTSAPKLAVLQLNFAVSALWQQSDAVGIDWRRTVPLQSATSMLLIVAKGREERQGNDKGLQAPPAKLTASRRSRKVKTATGLVKERQKEGRELEVALE